MRFFLILLLVGLASGCGSGPELAKVKGRIVKDGQPLDLPSGIQAAVTFTPILDGKPDDTKSVSAVMTATGEFELVASGGTVPTGKFHVSLLIVGKAGEKYKPFAAPTTTPLRAELKAGPNDIVLDLAKANG